MFDFKGLIDILLRRARDEQYSGPSATHLMSYLPRSDTLIALTEIVKAVAALNRDPKIALRERYRAVLDFDEKARPLIDTLVAIYRGRDHIDGMSPRQVLPSLLACWQELAAAYKVCLKQHAQRPSSRFAEHAELVTLRAVGYYIQQAKWAYIRYFDTDTKVWRNLNRLYQIADSAGFVGKPIVRYPGEAASSIADHYLRAALLRLAEPDRRRPEDVWRIDDWLLALHNHVKVDRVFRAREQSFAINLDDARPPMKLRRNMVGERYRYLSTEGLSHYLRELAQAASHGTMPAFVGPIDKADHSLIAHLLADLALVFSRAGQERTRRSERKASPRDVDAAPGLGLAISLLRAERGDWLNWSLLDESVNGMGAHYKASYDDRLQVGEIIALREQDGQTCLSVVRRLSKSRDNLVRVGAERLCAQPVPVSLDDAGGSRPALFCQDAGHGERALLLSRHDWQLQAEFTLAATSKRYQIRLGNLLEEMPDYVLCAFSVIARQGQPA
ncbi:hypothetical protein [Chitinimonas sp.]|uniref:hypothetical protein n=1 Tax=Chitinimonas sp. TaxID=1934313 RepID=UPI0035B389CC